MVVAGLREFFIVGTSFSVGSEPGSDKKRKRCEPNCGNKVDGSIIGSCGGNLRSGSESSILAGPLNGFVE